MNQFALTGNLTADPEIVKIADNTKVNFSFAWNNPFVKDKEKSASFFDAELWGKSAESFAKWHAKGDRICVYGRIEQERWEKEGQKRSKVKLKCEGYTNVKSRSNDGQTKGEVPDEEDMPF